MPEYITPFGTANICYNVLGQQVDCQKVIDEQVAAGMYYFVDNTQDCFNNNGFKILCYRGTKVIVEQDYGQPGGGKSTWAWSGGGSTPFIHVDINDNPIKKLIRTFLILVFVSLVLIVIVKIITK